MSEKQPTPFNLLKNMDDLCKMHSFELPKLDGQVTGWSGVAFILNGKRYLAPLDEVSEIINLPASSKVPGAKPWVIGLANVRGVLLPIMDLQGFLYNRANRSRKQRLLVIQRGDFLSSVAVDDVIGLQNFEDFERLKELPDVDEKIEPYIQDGFSRGDQVWPVFKLSALAEDGNFLQVTA